jgi:hypothetical protein
VGGAVSGEEGGWKSRRVLKLSVGKRRNVVTGGDVLSTATSLDEGINGAKALISWDRLVVICELLESRGPGEGIRK